MPSIKDKSTVEAIAREFTSNGRKKGLALLAVGYSKAYSIEGGRGCYVVFSNVHVIAAIEAIDAKNKVLTEYKVEQATKDLQKQIENLEAMAEKGNIAAVNAIAGLIKEKNDIHGLHKQHIQLDGIEERRKLSKAEELEAQAFARWRNRQSIA